jgi:murein DD-endopeptidase MepM/ murein hydrolase activator NlpD
LTQLSVRWVVDDNNTSQFQRLVIGKSGDGKFSSHLESAPLQANQTIASGSIKTSLFAATDDARIPDSIANQMAEIFGGDIDFQRSLRKGDRFSVVYETFEADGEVIKTGRVLSAEFVNGGKSYQSIWFQDPGQANAKGAYYNLEGKSLRHAFLASPVPFSRVTSGFQMRFHPILQTWKAHLGTDFGAPMGTPVRCVGDGVVDFAGVQNGYGNVVMVKHSGNQMTVYAHLSQIAVRKGQAVAQGQNLGAVGATGWATGPHLHFEFRVNGVHKDPLTIARASESVPISPAARASFNKLAAVARQQLSEVASLNPSNNLD